MATMCAKCEKVARSYCPDCEKSLCNACCAREHHPGTDHEKHSVEEIVINDTSGIKFLTPVIDELLIFIVAVFIWTQIKITERYLHTPDVCPLSNYIRETVENYDSGMFYAFKVPLSTYCNMEDSFWRLFTDMWVRNVVTDTDNLVVLGFSFFWAIFFHMTLLQILVPVISVFYAVFVTIFEQIENRIPQYAVLQHIEKWASKVNIAGSSGDAPPMTHWRRRRYDDYVELFYYATSRWSRQFIYFYSSTADTLTMVVKYPLYVCSGCRLMCIVFRLGSLIRWFCQKFGLDAFMSEHIDWFSPKCKRDQISERLLYGTFNQILGMFFSPEAGSAATSVLSNFVATSASILMNWQIIFLFALLFLPQWYVKRFLQKQRDQFEADWENGGREACLGSCHVGDECQCVCVQWRVGNDKQEEEKILKKTKSKKRL